MRVLVTGGRGWIGAYVCREIESRRWQPVRFDRADGDVRNVSSVSDAVRDCDAVINLAGVLGTEELFSDLDEAVQVNVQGAVNVFRAAAVAGVPVVQIGTGHKGQPNPYAITKAAAEDLALALHNQGQPIGVVRAFHAYGPGQKPPAPWGPPGTVVKAIPAWIQAALLDRPLHVFGTGRQHIDLVHVDDVARTLVEPLATARHAGWGGLLPDAGTGIGTTALAAADTVRRTVAAITGRPARSAVEVLGKPRPGEPLDAVVVAERPAEVVVHDWPHGLGETVAYYRDQYL